MVHGKDMAGRQQKYYKNSEKQHKYFVLNEEATPGTDVARTLLLSKVFTDQTYLQDHGLITDCPQTAQICLQTRCLWTCVYKLSPFSRHFAAFSVSRHVEILNECPFFYLECVLVLRLLAGALI